MKNLTIEKVSEKKDWDALANMIFDLQRNQRVNLFDRKFWLQGAVYDQPDKAGGPLYQKVDFPRCDHHLLSARRCHLAQRLCI